MSEKVNKPVVVSIVQFLLISFIVGGSLASLLAFWQSATKNNSGVSLVSSLLVFGMRLTILLLPFVLALRGIKQRKPYGRWIALSLLVIWAALLLYQNPNPFVYKETTVKGPLPTFEIKPEERGGAIFSQVLVYFGILALILNLVFAKSVRLFFKIPPQE